jgi:diguanylate cyclase
MSGDWRERYIELEQRTAQAASEHEEAERQLTRLITRLCVACAGCDPNLDRELERLRKLARGGRAGPVVRQSEAFADAIVRAAGERAKPGVLGRLLERASIEGSQAEALYASWAAVAADPAGASPARLDELSNVLRDVLAFAEGPPVRGDAGRTGWLGRLIGRGDAPQALPPNRLLLEALDAIAWPAEMKDRVAPFATTLRSDGSGDAWLSVVQEIGDLAAESLTRAQEHARATERFLAELNGRLEELDRHMLDEDERREAAQNSGMQLGATVDSEMVSLTASVRASESLRELQASVLGSLDRIQDHVRQHLAGENALRAQAEAEATRMRRQMRRLEQDSFDLRRQVAQTYQAAMRDALTGLPNRRAYDQQLAQEHARWKRFGQPLALLVFDVDDFKQVNDTFGHKSGDRALVLIARVLGENRRETDLVARLGGEEFVVLLPGADEADALRIAEQMRKAVAGCGLHAHQQPVRITVSGGLAVFRGDDDPEAVFERADAALYLAKRNGKNRVESAAAG